MKHTATTAILLDERKEDLLTTASSYTGAYQLYNAERLAQLDTSFVHDQLASRASVDAFNPRQLPALFDANDNQVNISGVKKGNYLEGTQYDALEGDDIVFLPKDVISAEQAGYNLAHVFYGNEGNDQIYVQNSFGNSIDYKIDGGAGDDRILSNYGNDTLWGGEGNDQLFGESHHDTLFGGEGQDKLYGGDQNDVLLGGAGNDELYGGAHQDILAGGDNDDQLYGEAGKDTLQGDAGDDHLYGQDQNDLLTGGSGNDVLEGGFNTDQLYGGDGDDKLIDSVLNGSIFDSAADNLFGGNGNDNLIVGAYDDGQDRMIGGSGDDKFTLSIYKPHAMSIDKCDIIVDFEDGHDTINLYNVLGDYFSSFSDLKILNANGDSYVFGKDGNIPIVIVQNAAGLLDASDFKFS